MNNFVRVGLFVFGPSPINFIAVENLKIPYFVFISVKLYFVDSEVSVKKKKTNCLNLVSNGYSSFVRVRLMFGGVRDLDRQ